MGMTKLPKTMPDTVPAASLAAFGGWQEAEWFSPAVLSDSDIVAFALPALSGVRKQNFRIVDRTLAKDQRLRASRGAGCRDAYVLAFDRDRHHGIH
jgi:hypothetical protein